MTGTAWDQLAARLSAVILAFVRGDTLILRKDRRRYVQFAHVGFAVHAETVSNEFLPPDLRLSTQQEQRLIELGWLLPDPPRHFNYQSDGSAPVSAADAQRLAWLLVHTLREIHGVDEPTELAVEGWNDETGQPLAFTVSA